MKSHRCAVAAVAAAVAALALGACSSGGGDAASAASPPATSQWLAVARGEVDVEGGLVMVGAHADGVVESVAAKPGDTVKEGQVLARLDPRAARIGVASARASVAGAGAQLAELRVALQQASQRASRLAQAARAGAATGAAAEQARDAVSTLKAKQAAANAAQDGARQQLAAAQLSLDATSVRAPVAGTVVARHVAIGQTVSVASAQPLFELLPERPHIVRAQLNVDAADAIHAGMHAEVVQASGGGSVYQATVQWVGQVLQPASLTPDPLERALANDVDCTLTLAPLKKGEAPLRIGERVLVRFPRRP